MSLALLGRAIGMLAGSSAGRAVVKAGIKKLTKAGTKAAPKRKKPSVKSSPKDFAKPVGQGTKARPNKGGTSRPRDAARIKIYKEASSKNPIQFGTARARKVAKQSAKNTKAAIGDYAGIINKKRGR